jgi:type II secretion system protein G
MFKATHVAVIPDIGGDDAQAAEQVSGGVAKAGQVQLLSIKESELPELKAAVKKLKLSRSSKRAVMRAMRAVESSVVDPSGQAALRHAATFASVHAKALSRVVGALAAQRKKRFTQLREVVSSVATEYAAARAQPSVREEPASSGVSPKPTRLSAGVINSASFGEALSTSPKLRTLAEHEGPGVAFDVWQRSKGVARAAPTVAPVAAHAQPTSDPTLSELVKWAAGNSKSNYAMLRDLSGAAPSRRSLSAKDYLRTLDEVAEGVVGGVIESGNDVAILDTFKQAFHVEPVGRLFLERLETTPAGIERGELVYSIPMTPNEEVNLSHREWAQQSEGFENIVTDELIGYSEKGVSEKSDVTQAVTSESKHSTALNVGTSLSASYASVSLSASFGYNSTSDDEQAKKDSRNHSNAVTSKAASRTRKDHKVTFKVASASETEDLAVRKIKNAGPNAVRYDYFRMMRKWRVDLIRYGLRMTYDIVIPSPGSALLQKIAQKRQIEGWLNEPLKFGLTPSGIRRDNWADLQTQWGAVLQPPPEESLVIGPLKPFHPQDPENKEFDFLPVDVDSQYTITGASCGARYDPLNKPQNPGDSTDSVNSYFDIVGDGPGGSIGWGGYGGELTGLHGRSGQINVAFVYWRITSGIVQLTLTLQLRSEALLAWQVRCWQTLRDAAINMDQMNRARLKERLAQLESEINSVSGLPARQMEREEIMKGVLQWLFGPTFKVVPPAIAQKFESAGPNDPITVALNPQNQSTTWQAIMEYGEFIKYIHNAIEWENILYVNYPYFWDSPSNWDFKLFLQHVDPEHRMFLRSGAARVVLTIREGFEKGFTELMETGAMQAIPYLNAPDHPYRKISDEIRSFARTNYPGIPPANPDKNVRPLLFPEQTRTWRDMQFLIQLLDAYRADKGVYPTAAQGLAALQPYLADVNDANDDIGWPTYQAVPLTDYWGNAFLYRCPGDTGDYDLISMGADNKVDTLPGGRDKNADISANAEGSVIATWFEYTPTSALDISVTTNLATIGSSDLA